MINVHGRVDLIYSLLQPNWYVVDFGCGDAYLSSLHPNTYNVDKEDRTLFKPLNAVVDLDYTIPELTGDCAVFSGVLEWLRYPLAVLRNLVAFNKFPNIIFSYSAKHSDPDWFYYINFNDLVLFFLSHGWKQTIIPWEGQGVFWVRK